MKNPHQKLYETKTRGFEIQHKKSSSVQATDVYQELNNIMLCRLAAFNDH